MRICRILVGSLFIVSGLIKVNDAIGFSYKLEEYFGERALGMTGLMEYALPIAIFIVIGEVLLGVAVLLGAWPKLTTTLILAMTLFFTWLTYYTSHCEPTSLAIFENEHGQYYIESPDCVLTCGCFGDAIKLEPIESFYKDVVLLVFIIPIFFAAWMNKIKLNTYKEDIIILIASLLVVAGFSQVMLEWLFPVLFTLISFGVGVLIKKMAGEKEWLMAAGVLAVCVFLQYWTLVHLPLKDYRAYAIGSDIRLKTLSAEERIATSDYARFVEEKVQPLTADSIDFLGEIGNPENFVAISEYLNAAKTSGSEAGSIATEFDKNKEAWLKEVESFQPPKFVNMYTLENKSTGQSKEVDSDAYLKQKMWEDKAWTINKDKTFSKKIKDGYEPPIKDFRPSNMDGADMLDSLLNYDKVYLLVMHSLAKTDTCNFETINAFALKAQKDGAKFFGISSSAGEEVEQFRFQHQTPFDFLANDGTELKIIVRSNPGLVYLEKGVVKDMWSNADIPKQ
jgi:uncharacterized membrane protein YphA (DoxX/SURF4 family)/peroxiredoxin